MLEEMKEKPKEFRVFRKCALHVLRRDYLLHSVQDGKMEHLEEYLLMKNMQILRFFDHEFFTQTG